jgi:hypothetical protein
LQSVKDTGLTSFAVVKRLSFRWNDESVALNLQAKILQLGYAPENPCSPDSNGPSPE